MCLCTALVLSAALVLAVDSNTVQQALVTISSASLQEVRGCRLPPTLSVNVEAGGKSLDLTLRKSDVDVNAPLLMHSHYGDNSVDRVNMPEIKDSASYQDLQHAAAIMVTCHEDSPHTHLTLHGPLVFHGKHCIIEHTKRLRRGTGQSRDYESEQLLTEVKRGVVTHDYREADPLLPPAALQEMKGDGLVLPVKYAGIPPSRHKRQTAQFDDSASPRDKRQASQYHIDVMVLVDFAIYKRFYEASQQTTDSSRREDALQSIRRYFAYIMNGVSLRYKSISSLGVMLNVRLMGYYVAETPSDAPWTETHREAGTVRPEVDADKVLISLREWVIRAGLRASDHYMMFTGYDMYSNDPFMGKSTATSGLAYIGTLCRPDGRSISLVEDFGGYQSIDTATHELGHGLNARHDGDNNSCSASSRYVMSGGSYPPSSANANNPWFFSSCSVSYFRSFLTKLFATGYGSLCLTTAQTADSVPDVSAKPIGQLYSPDEFCQLTHGPDSRMCLGIEFGEPAEVCTRMFCRDPNKNNSCFQHEAPRGFTCGNRKWCEEGRCVSSPQAPPAEEPCVFGDQRGAAFNGVSCAEFTGGDNSPFCYQAVVRGRCCSSCRRYYTANPACEYGDKVRGCDANFCDYVYNDGTRYDVNCCSTCGLASTFPPKETTTQPVTTRLTTTTTTRPTTTPVIRTTPGVCSDNAAVRFSGLTCAQYVAREARGCYYNATKTYCCASCAARNTGVQGCEYGDRSSNCDARMCNAFDQNGTPYTYYCCKTCANVPTTTEKIISTTYSSTPRPTSSSTPRPTSGTTTRVPSTTTPRVATTPSSCNDLPNCTERIRTLGPAQCYDPSAASACCQACTSLRDDTRPGCEFGDRSPEQCNNLGDLQTSCVGGVTITCCDTCRPTSAAPSMKHSTPFLLLAVFVAIYLVITLPGSHVC